ncbi:hypothetical protein NUU61_006774 [Penicillium alfredii]|uniref:Uncharacterized protein n=1 Tax=Penicillium alfredii TaxID=1506179 RepID=A0A9W9K3N6_9EURO|nr:uncharacterized protein NUU61_006774 [Penicillium alfredii]KAJ5091904.1 hypothetical protein NUU61_006774 [Penicillium alfredii]
MDVFRTAECFGGEGEEFWFVYTSVHYKQDGKSYRGKSPKQYPNKCNMNHEHIYDPILIPSDGLFPLFTPGFTEAPTSSSDASNWYIKRPDVWRL